ncbi:MAG: sortase [Clostridia bacterium]
MNQILVTKKLYITPELKKKKKIYKFNFILSLFFLIVLVSFYIYAAYDREKSEAVSQDILANADIPEEDTTVANSDILIAVLNDTTDDGEEEKPIVVPPATNNSNSSNANVTKTKEKSAAGYTYVVDGRIEIPKIKVDYPILSGETKSEQETESLLKISPLKFHGPEINEIGNYCIVGHNYRNSKFFSKVPTLQNGDIIRITDMSGKVVEYSVYSKYNVVPTDVSCTSQETNGKKEITLITCTNDSKERVIVKARAI